MIARIFTLLVALSFALTAVGNASDPFEINVIVSQSGNGAFLGQKEAAALKIAEAIVNKSGGIDKRPVKFVFSDDQSNPGVAVQLLNGLIGKKVPVVLGSSLVSPCSAMGPIAQQAGPLIYCFSPGFHPTSGYLYSSGISTLDLLSTTAAYFRRRGWTKVAIMTTTDATGQEGERTIDAAFSTPENKVETIVTREKFNISDISVTAQMERVKASGAQVLIAWCTGSPLGTVLNGANQVGLNLPVLTSSGNMAYDQLEGYASFAPRELLFPASPGVVPAQLRNGPTKRAVVALADAFKTAGLKVEQGHTLSWDPAFILVSAYRSAGPNATAEQLKAAIDNLHAFNGVNGPYDYRAVPQRGLGAGNVIIARWEPAKHDWSGVSLPGGTPLK